MKHIEKQSPPETFMRYRRKQGASFQDLSTVSNRDVKQCLRESLLVEQGFICCYCGQEIDSHNSVIEHLKSKDYFPLLQLDYENLLCSCVGGQDRRTQNPTYPLHCDANKGNLEIYVSPLDEECEIRFDFDEEGNIHGLDEEAQETIRVLNLNNPKLKNKRKNAIDAYRYLADEYTDWSCEHDFVKNKTFENKFPSFCFVIQRYIENYRLSGVSVAS